MFGYVVPDPEHIDINGANICMDDFGNLYLRCHPDLLEKVLDGIEQSQGIKLLVIEKDEWEKENKRFFSKG